MIDLRSFNFVKPGFRWEFADQKNVRNPSTSWCQNQWLHGFLRKNTHEDGSLEGWYVMICFEFLWYLMICSCPLGLCIHVTCYIPSFFLHSFFSMPWDGDSIQFFGTRPRCCSRWSFDEFFQPADVLGCPTSSREVASKTLGPEGHARGARELCFSGPWYEVVCRKKRICVIKKSDVRCGTSHGEDEFEWFWGTFASPLEKTWLCKLFRVFRGLYDPVMWGL